MMYASIFCYVRHEVNRPLKCVNHITIDKEPEESDEAFRERVETVFLDVWKQFNWDNVTIDVHS